MARFGNSHGNQIDIHITSYNCLSNSDYTLIFQGSTNRQLGNGSLIRKVHAYPTSNFKKDMMKWLMTSLRCPSKVVQYDYMTLLSSMWCHPNQESNYPGVEYKSSSPLREWLMMLIMTVHDIHPEIQGVLLSGILLSRYSLIFTKNEQN